MIAPLTKYFGWPADGPGSAWAMTGERLAWWDGQARQMVAAVNAKSKGRRR